MIYNKNLIEKFYIWVVEWLTFFKKELNFGGYNLNPKRISYWLKGFHSQRPVRYDFKKWNYKSFVSDIEMIKLTFLNYPYSKLLRNKMIFANYFRNYFKTPKNYFLLSNGYIKTVSDDIALKTFEDIERFLEQKNNIILKPVFGARGNGIYLLEAGVDSQILLNKKKISKQELSTFLTNLNEYLGCEFIDQGRFSKKFFQQTTNTVRITTMYNEETKSAFIPYALMRFGRPKTIPADNSAIGGLLSMIKLETGELEAAIEFDSNGEPIYYDSHPETGEIIKGVSIPNWRNLVKKILEIAEIIGPIIKIVGWDIVLRDEDFVVIEGNNGPDLFIQGISTPLAKYDNVKSFLKCYKIR